jgi:hypothetical protein
LKDYLALRWLRVPILAPELEPVLRTAIQKTPVNFFTAWTDNSDLPQGIRLGERGFDEWAILRHFLWNEFPARYYREVIQAIGACNLLFDEMRCGKHLSELSEISPLLLWWGMKECQRKCEKKCSFLFETFKRSQVGLSMDAKPAMVTSRLQGLQGRATDATRLGKGRLQEICNLRIRTLETPGKSLTDSDCQDLLRLSATKFGRRYLAAHIAQHILGRHIK